MMTLSYNDLKKGDIVWGCYFNITNFHGKENYEPQECLITSVWQQGVFEPKSYGVSYHTKLPNGKWSSDYAYKKIRFFKTKKECVDAYLLMIDGTIAKKEQEIQNLKNIRHDYIVNRINQRG